MNRTENSVQKSLPVRSSHVRPAPEAGNAEHNGRTGPIENPMLVAFRSKFSPVSEEYKKLKARIMRMTKQDPFKNVLMVTSSVGGEGKSITAANLAFSLARDYDHSVLLIDADTRKPSLHTLLNVKQGIGLSDCLVDNVDLGAAMVKVGNGNLKFLSAGKSIENPVELFSSHRMQNMIVEMKHRYPDRYIIIDTPPVLLFAETKMLSALVDGIIFVVREGKAPLNHITEALDWMKEEKIMGIVYNDAGPEGINGKYPYHTYYDHYHRKK
jgi:receptor protein-tyrosine kinase/non-specific protein-tyrosine kinase